MREQYLREGSVGIGSSPRQQSMIGRPKRVDVGPLVEFLLTALLGTHVVRSAGATLPGRRPLRRIYPARQAEVRELDGSVGGAKQVGRLDIAVDDAAGVH